MQISGKKIKELRMKKGISSTELSKKSLRRKLHLSRSSDVDVHEQA